MERGQIKKLFVEKGFGFVIDTYRAEHFFHATQCGDSFDSLRVGDSVAFEVGAGRDGRTQANNVKVIYD
jgi:cold shock CspA family protein